MKCVHISTDYKLIIIINYIIYLTLYVWVFVYYDSDPPRHYRGLCGVPEMVRRYPVQSVRR
jgi:hypothetical protein